MCQNNGPGLAFWGALWGQGILCIVMFSAVYCGLKVLFYRREALVSPHGGYFR